MKGAVQLASVALLAALACQPFAVPGLGPLVVSSETKVDPEPTMCGFDRRVLPELEAGTSLKPLIGAADYHNHQFSNIGFGGRVLWGASFHPDGIAQALSACGAEGLCADDRELAACRAACLFAGDSEQCRAGCDELRCVDSTPHGHLGLTDPVGAALRQGIGHRTRGYPGFEG